MAERTPVLWLAGAPGVGKSTVGWELYRQLVAEGVLAAYVDIDQLGICYPESAADPGRHRLKERNLGAIVANYTAGGADCVVVSGVVDSERGIEHEHLGHANLTVCLLRADHADLRARFLEREGSDEGDVISRVLAEADQLDAANVTDLRVDTTGRSVADVVRDVRERTNWPNIQRRSAPSPLPSPATEPPGGRILWIFGPTGVGKSTIGFRVYLAGMASGETTAYIDLGQLGFAAPVPADDPYNHRLKAANLAAVWRNYYAAGARSLVMTGQLDDIATLETYAHALPAATLTLCRLCAGPATLADRIRQRHAGHSWAEPGDPLRGLPAEQLPRVAEEAAAAAAHLDGIELGDIRIDTDALEPDDVVDLVMATTGWLGGHHHKQPLASRD